MLPFFFFLRPNPALKRDVNDELLVKGLTALTISPRGSLSKLNTNARVPEPESWLGGKHVLLADTIRMARIACSKSMSGEIVDLRCKLNPTFLGLRSYFSPFEDERIEVNGSGEYCRVQNSYSLDCSLAWFRVRLLIRCWCLGWIRSRRECRLKAQKKLKRPETSLLKPKNHSIHRGFRFREIFCL